MGHDVSCQAHPRGQRGEAMPHPAEQAGRDATSPAGLAPPGTQQGQIFSTAAGFFHVAPWLLQASQSARTATPGCLTQATPQSLSQRALDFYHRGEDKEVPRASVHILQPHPVFPAQLEPAAQGPTCARGCPSWEMWLRPASAGWWLRIKES